MRTIFHVDGDAFFAACEQAVHPDWVGRAVITGAERGIVSAASYEAKAKGVSRGTALWDVHRIIPDAIIVPSDYETYSTFSNRMFNIVRRFTPEVEEYSIDEAFVDVTGCDRMYNCSYNELALRIQSVVVRELGISVSIGIGPSKVLAKVGSKWKKPSGVTEITVDTRESYLSKLDVEKIWGIGNAHAARFRMAGIRTAWQFASMPESTMKQSLYKPLKEIWHELNGTSVNPVITSIKQAYKSISKVKTFTPPSSNALYLKARIMRNLENACIKARRYGLLAGSVGLYLRKQDFRSAYGEHKLAIASVYPSELFSVLENMFDTLFDQRALYRATGVVLLGLHSTGQAQKSLFSHYNASKKLAGLYKSMDQINRRYGKHTVATGTSLRLTHQPYHTSSRGNIPIRAQKRLIGETSRQRINIPLLHVVV